MVTTTKLCTVTEILEHNEFTARSLLALYKKNIFFYFKSQKTDLFLFLLICRRFCLFQMKHSFSVWLFCCLVQSNVLKQ